MPVGAGDPRGEVAKAVAIVEENDDRRPHGTPSTLSKCAVTPPRESSDVVPAM